MTPTRSAGSPCPQKPPQPADYNDNNAIVMISAPIAGCTIVIGAKQRTAIAAIPDAPSTTIVVM